MRTLTTSKQPHVDALESLISAMDKLSKINAKYKSAGQLGEDVFAFVRGCIDATATKEACKLIEEYGLQEMQQLTGLLKRRVKSIAPNAGGHPGGGRIWTEGLAKVIHAPHTNFGIQTSECETALRNFPVVSFLVSMAPWKRAVNNS
jgi:hypothetical protein